MNAHPQDQELEPETQQGDGTAPPTHEPTSEKQIAANKENARKSTGPRSEAGKHRSRQNATQHGAHAAITFPIPSGAYAEHPAELDEFVHGLVLGLDPRDSLEIQQAKQVALAYVRLDRLDRLEADLAGNDGCISGATVQRLADPARFLAETAGGKDKGPKRTPWIGTRRHVGNVHLTVVEMLGVLRDPDEVDTWDPDWENLARLVRTHSGKSEVGVRGLWNNERTPRTPDEWKRAFHALRRYHWPDVEDAIAWAMRFIAEELPRLGEIAGRALAAAASLTLENSFSRASQLRTRVNRDLMTHLRIYSEMQKRVLVVEDMEDADGGKDPDSTD